ncbi:MAG TPA: CDP-glycerol glycerophosphotransferase family protein [Actinoplanes sp.]
MPELVPGMVSVVVPIYNVEPFLSDCLDSIRAQTYRNLQAILVDDGSTDGSVAIAAEYVAADERFQLVRQPNGGLSAARNTGTPYARGEYLAFVDSDDILAAHAYETLVQALAAGADFASGGVHRFSSRGHHRGYPHDEAIRTTDLHTHVSADHRLLRDRTIWNKVFRRSFWDRHGFLFPPGRLFEDVPVCVPAHAWASSVAVVSETIYFWRAREGAQRSITQSDNNLRNLVDRFHSTNLVRRMLADSGQDELCRVYQEQAIWDKLSNYLKYLPGATQEYRDTFMELATAYLDDIDPGAADRQPDNVRRQWQLIRAGRVDELVELIDQQYRAPAPVVTGTPRVRSALRDSRWRDGRLQLSGYAFVPGASAARPWSSARLLWLKREDGPKVLLPALPRRAGEIPGEVGGPGRSAEWSGFSVSLDPASLRIGGQWRPGVWDVVVAATGGVRLRQDGIRVPVDRPVRLSRHEVDPGVWVLPSVSKGRLRIRLLKAQAWVTGIRRDGDDLLVEGRLRARTTGPVRLQLNRANGVVARSVPVDLTTDGNRRGFSARLPLTGIALDDRSDNHATGLYAQRFAVELLVDDNPVHLLVDQGQPQLRTVVGTDEVYTRVSGTGYLWIATRPAGPVATSVGWRADGALVLSGDSPYPMDGELLLRRRGRNLDVSLPLRVVDGRWEVVVDPSAVPTLAGALPLVTGTWDFAVRTAGIRHDAITRLGFTDDALAALPAEARPGGVRCLLRAGTHERVMLVVSEELPVEVRSDAAQERLRTRHFPATGRPALRDAMLFDAAPGRRFPDDPAAVLAEVARRPDAPPARWTAELGQPVPACAERVALHSEKWYECLATSRWIVTNDDLPRWFRPQTGQVVLRLAGGWPIARSGAGARAHPLGRELVEQISSDSAGWTALASPSRSATSVLRAEMLFGGKVLEVGRPANDLLHDLDAEAARTEVLRRLGLAADTRLVLYAPTRRPMDLRKRGWSDPGRLLDLPRVAAGLPADHVLLARRHPALADDVTGLAPGVVDVSRYPRAAELLLASDVLITDYSALMADFAVIGRPILLYVPDLAEFEVSPGLNIDLAASAPGLLLRTSTDVVAALRDINSVAAEYEAARKAFADSHGAGDEGGAASEIVDWLLSCRGTDPGPGVH